MTKVRRVIRADGTETSLANAVELHEIQDAIDAAHLDVVVLDQGYVMWVDDLGHIKGLPVNEVATRLYQQRCHPGVTHVIRGDVVVVPNSDYGDEAS